MSLKKQAHWEELQALFPRYLSGDSLAIQTLFSTIQTALEGYFYTRLRTKDDVQDLVQVTLLKIHLARDKFDLSQSLKTWVFTIASRSLIDHWRKLETDQADLAASDETSFTHQESPLISPELKTMLNKDLNRALNILKPIDRQIVYLYGVEEMPMAEIAQVLKLSEAAVKLRAHRAYKELRAQLNLFFWIFICLGGPAWILFSLSKKT